MRNRIDKTSRSTRTRRAVVLLVVLVAVVLLTLAAYQFSEFMNAEYHAVDSQMRVAQARSLAESGIHYAAAALASQESITSTLGGNPYDNSQMFQGISVAMGNEGGPQGRFSVIAPLDMNSNSSSTTSQGYRYGVMDEASKFNINALVQMDRSGKIAHDVLMRLPNMTEDIADAIVDWIDADDTPRANGAENQYYNALQPSYRARNGPLDTLEELLLVRGVTAQLLFGNDKNRNGLLDPDEEASGGTLDRGWSAYLTMYTREKNIDSEGQPRIYINSSSDPTGVLEKLTAAVGSDLANFIMAYRLYGSSAQSGSSSQGSSSGRGGSSSSSRSSGGQGRITLSMDTFRRGRPRRISSLFELVNAEVSIPSSVPNGQPTRYASPLSDPGQCRELLPKLLDKATTLRNPEIQGRVNINTAPQAVLAALPGLTEADVQGILDHRPSLSNSDPPDAIYRTPAWLITEAGFSPEKLRTMERYITASSQVYRVQSVGHFDNRGATARIEAVIDTNGGKPRIVYWRDLTELGKGFNLRNNP